VVQTHVADEVDEKVPRHFTEEEVAILTMVRVTINGDNRLAISFRAVPGACRPQGVQS
jgi:hypothetical protein